MPERFRPRYLPHNDSLVVSPPVTAPEAHTAPHSESLIDPDKIKASPERKAKVLELLQEGTEQILNSENFGAYLRMMAKFHHYSFNNTLLIMTQKPDATQVNSYDRWQTLGRQVVKGEHGIKIFFPMFTNVENEDPLTGEKKKVQFLRGFGIGNVFDVSQTDGEPLLDPPKPPAPLNGSSETAKEVNIKLSRLLLDQEVKCESKVFPGSAGGYWMPEKKLIVVRRGEGDPLNIPRTRTLAHEASHYLADHRSAIDRAYAETVAEASAYVTLEHFGIDTGETSFHYIANWAQSKDVLRSNLGEVQKVSNALITGIEGIQDPYAEDFSDPSAC